MDISIRDKDIQIAIIVDLRIILAGILK